MSRTSRRRNKKTAEQNQSLSQYDRYAKRVEAKGRATFRDQRQLITHGKKAGHSLSFIATFVNGLVPSIELMVEDLRQALPVQQEVAA